MWATGRVRDRAERAAAKRRWGSRFFRACPEKWWGPVVLDAAPKPTSPSDFCERDLSNLCRDEQGQRKNQFPTLWPPDIIGCGGDPRPPKGTLMARSKPSARDALKKLREQRLELDAQEVRLRDEAATELGKMLVECGAETIEPAELKRVVQASMALGIDETLKRLTAK